MKRNSLQTNKHLQEILERFPYYECVNMFDGKVKTEWFWYCPKCVTGFYRTPTALKTTKTILCRCNTVIFRKWTQQLREHQIKEICIEEGLSFLGWEDTFKNSKSRFYLKCKYHPHYTSNVNNFTSVTGRGCYQCGKQNPHNKKTLTQVIAQATKVHGNQYDYSLLEYVDSRNSGKVKCNTCEEVFETSMDNHINKKRGCPVCSGKSQRQSYIFIIKDGDIPVAIKSGIANFYDRRLAEQQRVTSFDVEVLGMWEYKEISDCKLAEKTTKDTLQRNVLTKKEYPDGFSETYNLTDLESIIKILEIKGERKI